VILSASTKRRMECGSDRNCFPEQGALGKDGERREGLRVARG